MKERTWQTDTRLFWFLRGGISLDLSNPRNRDRVVQQVLTHGTDESVILLLKKLSSTEIRNSFVRIQSFLPKEIRYFWEEYLGVNQSTPKKDPANS